MPLWKQRRPGSRAEQNGRICLFCFFAGLAAGTLAGNGLGKIGEVCMWPVGAEVWGSGQEIWRRQPGSWEKFSYLFRHRMSEGIMGWILGLTVCAAPAFCLLSLYAGFAMGWVITCCTLARGILGLPVFLLSCFPQMLFYLPVWGLLVWWGIGERRRIRVLPALLAAVILSAGAAAETFWNPFFLHFL